MRSILHPGPVAAQRIQALPAHTRLLEVTLAPALSLLDAVTLALPAGTASAVLRLSGGALFPLAYAMPALSTTPEHAVYFSPRFEASGPGQLETASITYGLRDGQPWLHCHAQWTEPDGSHHCGHVLPDQAMVCQAITASACLLDGAQFQVAPDTETHFSLFQPVALATLSPEATAANALVMQLRPNVDVCSTIEAICREQGINHATVHGGVGSTVGAAFEDGSVVEPFVTEVLIRSGRVTTDTSGTLRAAIDVSLVDYQGGMAQGRLLRGANPVLVTFELVLVAD
jgi:predicted DNA-binding protein with PD1-like motif